MSAGSTLNHRPDIDGLRAIAVGSVVLYHCGFARYLPGGFIGVDIFFVISGFLITGIVSSDIEKGRFSLIDFYNRRIRRIFPALFCVYAFVFVAAFMTLMPSEVGTVTAERLPRTPIPWHALVAPDRPMADGSSHVAVLPTTTIIPVSRHIT